MRVLYVCTANICRSASAEWLLRDALAADAAPKGIEIRSAGTHAIVGAPGCSMAPALVGHAAEHRSTPLTAELVAWADLILTAARDHRSAVVVLDPAARSRTFTIRQAGRISDWILEAGMVAAARARADPEVVSGSPTASADPVSADPASGRVSGGSRGSGSGTDPGAGTADSWAARFEPGDPRGGVVALPAGREAGWRWLVGEMDAARGMGPLTAAGGGSAAGAARPERGRAGGRWFRRPPTGPFSRGPEEHQDDIADPDDVPDPHVLGAGLHLLAFEQLQGATTALVRLLHAVAE